MLCTASEQEETEVIQLFKLIATFYPLFFPVFFQRVKKHSSAVIPRIPKRKEKYFLLPPKRGEYPVSLRAWEHDKKQSGALYTYDPALPLSATN